MLAGPSDLLRHISILRGSQDLRENITFEGTKLPLTRPLGAKQVERRRISADTADRGLLLSPQQRFAKEPKELCISALSSSFESCQSCYLSYNAKHAFARVEVKYLSSFQHCRHPQSCNRPSTPQHEHGHSLSGRQSTQHGDPNIEKHVLATFIWLVAWELKFSSMVCHRSNSKSK